MFWCGVLKVYLCNEADKDSAVIGVELFERVTGCPDVIFGVKWCGLEDALSVMGKLFVMG